MRRVSGMVSARCATTTAAGLVATWCQDATARRWLTPKRKQVDPSRPWTKNDDFHPSRATEESDTSLQVDKTMALTSVVEEMSTADVQLRVGLAIEAYSPALYAYAFFDSVDIYRMMLQKDLAAPGAEAELSRWFMNPGDFFRDPTVVPEAMGTARWELLAKQLEQMLMVYDAEVSPIRIALQRHRLPASTWLPLARWLVSEGCEGDFKTVFASFCLALANGRGPVSLMLPATHVERVRIVGDVLLAAAKEFGRVQVGSLACELLNTVGYKMSFGDQKALMHAVARSNRRSLDWQLRHSGSILAALHSWRTYLATTDGVIGTVPINAVDESATDETESTLAVDEDEEAAAVTDFARGIDVDEAVVAKPAGVMRDAEFGEDDAEEEEEDADAAAARAHRDLDDDIAVVESDDAFDPTAVAEGAERESEDDVFGSGDDEDKAPVTAASPESIVDHESAKAESVATFFATANRATATSSMVDRLLAELPTETRGLREKRQRAETKLRRAQELDADDAAKPIDAADDEEPSGGRKRRGSNAALKKRATTRKKRWGERMRTAVGVGEEGGP